MSSPFRVEVLGAAHDRTVFACGVEALDQYLVSQVTQDIRRRVSACYVAVEAASGRVAGYYTLAAGGVPLNDLASDLIQLGAALLADAALRAARSEVAVHALVVDAKDDAAAAFYRHHGFEPFGGQSRQLIVPLARFKAG